MIKSILKNKIIVIALLILTFIVMFSVNTRVKAAGSSTFDPDGGGSQGSVKYQVGDEFTVTFGVWSCNENVFCVQHGQDLSLGNGKTYKVKACYEITGTDIKVNGSSINPSNDLLNFAQGIAYILQQNNVWRSSKENAQGNKGIAQHVLWEYLYYSTSAECGKIGMYKGSQEQSSSLTGDGNETTIYNKAQQIRNGTRDKDYYAKYYVFEKTTNPSSQQRLIILEKAEETERQDDLSLSLSLEIEKIDAIDSSIKLAGATFEVKIQQPILGDLDLIWKDVCNNRTITTDEDGIANIDFSAIPNIKVDTKKTLKVVIEEVKAPVKEPGKYSKLKDDIEFNLKYSGSEWTLKNNIPSLDGLVTGKVNDSKISLTIANKKINSISLNLLKESSIDEKTDGTEFSFDFTNIEDFEVRGKYISKQGMVFGQEKLYTVKKESGKWMTEGIVIEALIVNNGGIFIDKMNFANPDNGVEIKIKEITPPADHGKIENEIIIKVKLDDDKAVITQHTEETDEIKEIKVDGTNKFQINVKLTNYALINITGKVWLDGQTGIKTASDFNGEKDSNENWMEGIKVYLYGAEAEPVTTNANGEYLFENVKYKPGMYVVFEYDGINYIATKKIESAGNITSDATTSDPITSDATEIGRNDFNKKFARINYDAAYSKSGNKTTDLNYDETSSSTEAIVDTTGDIFKIQASADKINTYESDVEFNCGLVLREFDMDLTTNLDFVEVKINGKTTDYKYSIDEDGNATLVNKDGGKAEKPTYNQYLYESDYNYDIGDYFDNTNEEYNLTDDEKNNLKEDADKITNTEELEVFVTYKINVNNQKNEDAYIYQITDYYSDCFEGIVECYYMDGDNKETISSDNISNDSSDKINYSKATINLDKKLTDVQPVQSIYIKLKLKEFTDMSDLEVGNMAEISCYGSDEGFIDMNSRPGNMINSDGTIRYEDDTDEAGTLNILWTDKERTLTGVVWDDSPKENPDAKEEPDGVYTQGEDLINGVTVQLIELKEIMIGETTYQLEYIWQETKTGSNTVLKNSIDGKSVKEYTYTNDISLKDSENYIYVENYDENKENFHYLFTGFIPGNYIIRYKYGTDGGSYDGNVYKSTYDRTGEDGTAGTRYLGKSELNVNEAKRYSDAYDNEARRLGEMSIFAGETITKDSINNLAEHWMCADTNKFAAQIENKDNVVTDGIQAVKVNNSEYKEEYNLSEVDFGIMKRPETEISLEKHLTALAIDVAGEGKILDATFDLAGYLNEKSTSANPDNVKLEKYLTGNTDNLSQIYSTRGERGFWKVETDVNELVNGAELSAEYTYVVSNNSSDTDYLTAQLVDAYEKLSSGFACEFKFEENPDVTITLMPGEGEGLYTYQSLLKDLESRTKTMIRKGNHTNGYYIGKFYYTGEAATNDKPVTVQVNKIEELLNNEFVFDERINYSSYGDNRNYSSAYTSTSQEKLIDYQHIEYNDDGTKVLDSNKFAQDSYKLYNENGEEIDVKIKIEKDAEGKESATITANDKDGYTIVQSRAGNKYLEPTSSGSDLTERVDIARKVVLTKTLNTSNINDMLFDSYNAEILSYSVASGRRSTSSIPGNLGYSYSANSEDTLISMKNESDEFWGETIIITAPTGEDGISTTLWIILGVTCALIIAGGIFGIKKFVLKH